jgi:uncharacterized protein YgiM (DUF1202 family)
MTDKDFTICGHGSGTPSLKNMHTYCVNRYAQKAHGKHKGVIVVRRHITMNDTYRSKFKSTYKTILGRNIYSQDRRNYVYTKYSDGKYYSDCSSSGMATMEKIGLNTGGLLNTAGIYQSSKFKTVTVKIKNGIITNPEILEIGDCLLFVGSDPSRPKQIGHVEYVYSVPWRKANVTRKGLLRDRKSQNGKALAKVMAGDQGKIIKDCKDGWSEAIFEDKIGYIKNSVHNGVGKSSFPIGEVTADCIMKEKSSGINNKAITNLHRGAKVKVITVGPKHSYVKTTDTIGVKGWIPTKDLDVK